MTTKNFFLEEFKKSESFSLVKFFSPENSDYYIVNLSSGKKIAINSSNKLSEQDVLPGDLLKLYNI